jgi:hypothetical protein
MEKWVAAFAAMGGLTAFGGLIDLAIWKAEKEKLKSWLEDWWLRFTDMYWSNFGREEAELAVQILDRWAGPRLWSWKRWRFSIIVTVLAASFALLWTFLRALDTFYGYSYYVGRVIEVLVQLVPTTVAFALSLSVTRFIAVRAGQWCTGKVLNGFIFAALLTVHWILFCYWSAIVFVAERTAIGLILAPAVLIFSPEEHFSVTDITEFLKALLLQSLPSALGGWFPWPDWSALAWPNDDYWYSERLKVNRDVWINSFKITMDLIANGLRIVFALVFLSSFIFRPLIQEPVSRLWYGAMNSGKPFFTMLFGAVGVLVAVAHALSK